MTSVELSKIIAGNFWKRRLRNLFWCSMIVLSAGLALATLFYVFGYVVGKGWPALNLDFFTQLPKPTGESGGGMGNALVGTMMIVLMASLVGMPVGIFTGVYLSEYGRGKFASAVRFSADLLTSVPSIVVGLFVYVIVVRPMQRFSAIAGAVALAVIMVPGVARTTEEILRLVPTHIREAGLALGLPRWKVILRIVLRGALGGLTTGAMLAVARAAGETAPLIFTAFGNVFWHKGIDQPTATLPVQIYTYALSPYDDWRNQAWAGALVLVVFVFVMNLVTRSVLRPANSGRD